MDKHSDYRRPATDVPKRDRTFIRSCVFPVSVHDRNEYTSNERSLFPHQVYISGPQSRGTIRYTFKILKERKSKVQKPFNFEIARDMYVTY